MTGLRIGHEGDAARKSEWQFLDKPADPRLSALRKFEGAVGVPMADLFPEPKKSKAK